MANMAGFLRRIQGLLLIPALFIGIGIDRSLPDVVQTKQGSAPEPLQNKRFTIKVDVGLVTTEEESDKVGSKRIRLRCNGMLRTYCMGYFGRDFAGRRGNLFTQKALRWCLHPCRH